MQAKSTFGCINRRVASTLRKTIIPLHSALVRQPLHYGVQFWIPTPLYKKDVDKLKWVEQEAPKLSGAEVFALKRESEAAGIVQPGKNKD